MKGIGRGFPYVGPLKEMKIVAQSEGADSRAQFGPLDLEPDATTPGKTRLW